MEEMDNIVLRRTLYDRIIEALCILALLYAFFPLTYYEQLGVVNVLPILALVFYIVFSFSEKFYRYYNRRYSIGKQRYPSFTCTEENAVPLYRTVVQIVRHAKLALILLSACVSNGDLARALGKEDTLYRYGAVVVGIGFILAISIYYSKIWKYRN
jgi:hypothetical protein